MQEELAIGISMITIGANLFHLANSLVPHAVDPDLGDRWWALPLMILTVAGGTALLAWGFLRVALCLQ